MGFSVGDKVMHPNFGAGKDGRIFRTGADHIKRFINGCQLLWIVDAGNVDGLRRCTPVNVVAIEDRVVFGRGIAAPGEFLCCIAGIRVEVGAGSRVADGDRIDLCADWGRECAFGALFDG